MIYIKEILEIIKSLSIIGASFVAIFTVNTWRKENIWKRKFEIAEETLVLFYHARDLINSVRNPFYHIGEGESRKKSPNETQSETELLNRAYVVIERFEKSEEVFNNIKRFEYKFKAVFGSEKAKPFYDINRLMVEIIKASQILGWNYWLRQGKGQMGEEELQQYQKERDDFESKIWMISEKDETSIRLDLIIQNIEDACKVILDRK